MLVKVLKLVAVISLVMLPLSAYASQSGVYGIDIQGAGYRVEGGYSIFYMDLTKDARTMAPDLGYGFYLDFNGEAKGGLVEFNTGKDKLPLVGIDSYFITPMVAGDDGKSQFAATTDYHQWDLLSKSFTTQGTVAFASGDGKHLEWRMAEIDKPFWWGVVQKEEGNDNLKLISSAATPIPAAGWLLGTGIMGLVAVRRRKA